MKTRGPLEMNPNKVYAQIKIVPSPAHSRVHLVGRQPVTPVLSSPSHIGSI